MGWRVGGLAGLGGRSGHRRRDGRRNSLRVVCGNKLVYDGGGLLEGFGGVGGLGWEGHTLGNDVSFIWELDENY